MLSRLYEHAVDLYFGDRAHADTHAEHRHADEIPLQPGCGIVRAAGVVDPALHEHAAGADRLRIFGEQRPLLREHGSRRAQDEDADRERERAPAGPAMADSPKFSPLARAHVCAPVGP